MIIGLPRWNEPDAYYSQTNNVVETILVKCKADRRLETCGPTAAVCILDALGKLPAILTPGGWRPQPEDILAAWFNDPRNYGIMRELRGDLDPAVVMGNEVPQWYSAAIDCVFDVPAMFYWGNSAAEIIKALQDGQGVMATLKSPGHYIAIVAADMDTGEVIYHDPWPNNPWPARNKGQPGRCRRVTFDELTDNLQPWRVEIGV